MSDTPTFSSDSMCFDPAYDWRVRIVRASLGTTTGLIAMAMLAKRPAVGPAFGPTCEIDTEGRVYTMVRALRMDRTSRFVGWSMEMIGTIISVRDNMRRLADHCKLSDSDRLAMFEELRKWVKKDARAVSEN